MFKVTRFCVQPWERKGSGIIRGEAQVYYTRDEALRVASAARKRVARVDVYEVTGWPGQDLWGKPKLISREGG